jgi:hypothetical protein
MSATWSLYPVSFNPRCEGSKLLNNARHSALLTTHSVGVAVVSAALRIKVAPSALNEISLSVFPHWAVIYLVGFL